jgi:hypothetical protein
VPTLTHRETIPVHDAYKLGPDGCAALAANHIAALMDGMAMTVDSVTERVVLVGDVETTDCTLGVARECGLSVQSVEMLVKARF